MKNSKRSKQTVNLKKLNNILRQSRNPRALLYKVVNNPKFKNLQGC